MDAGVFRHMLYTGLQMSWPDASRVSQYKCGRAQVQQCAQCPASLHACFNVSQHHWKAGAPGSGQDHDLHVRSVGGALILPLIPNPDPDPNADPNPNTNPPP